MGFSKSSQVPFTFRSPRGLEGDGLLDGVHEPDRALAEALPELVQELLARAHQEPARADLGLRAIFRGAHEEVYRAAPGVTTQERQRIAELEREVRELRRANEILKAAASFFARELDPRPPRS